MRNRLSPTAMPNGRAWTEEQIIKPWKGDVAASDRYGGRGRRLVATADWGGRGVLPQIQVHGYTACSVGWFVLLLVRLREREVLLVGSCE